MTPLTRYTVNNSSVTLVTPTMESARVANAWRNVFELATGHIYALGNFSISHFGAENGEVTYFVRYGELYLCTCFICWQESASLEAWEAAERNFFDATEKFHVSLDLGWEEKTPPSAPWLATVLLPSFLVGLDPEVAIEFGRHEPCIAWGVIDFLSQAS